MVCLNMNRQPFSMIPGKFSANININMYEQNDSNMMIQWWWWWLTPIRVPWLSVIRPSFCWPITDTEMNHISTSKIYLLYNSIRMWYRSIFDALVYMLHTHYSSLLANWIQFGNWLSFLNIKSQSHRRKKLSTKNHK